MCDVDLAWTSHASDVDRLKRRVGTASRRVTDIRSCRITGIQRSVIG